MAAMVFGQIMSTICFSYANQYARPPEVSVLVGSCVLWTVVFTAGVGIEPMRMRSVVAMAIASLALVWIAMQSHRTASPSESVEQWPRLGEMFALLTSIGIAVSVVGARSITITSPELQMAEVASCFC